jgi:hypothetical protein
MFPSCDLSSHIVDPIAIAVVSQLLCLYHGETHPSIRQESSLELSGRRVSPTTVNADDNPTSHVDDSPFCQFGRAARKNRAWTVDSRRTNLNTTLYVGTQRTC